MPTAKPAIDSQMVEELRRIYGDKVTIGGQEMSIEDAVRMAQENR